MLPGITQWIGFLIETSAHEDVTGKSLNITSKQNIASKKNQLLENIIEITKIENDNEFQVENSY